MRKFAKIISLITAMALMTPASLGWTFAAEETDACKAMLAGMSAEEKISQMLMPTLRYYTDAKGEKQGMTALTEDAANMLKRHGFAGVILFAQNLKENEEAAKLTDAIQRANASTGGRTQLFMAVDQEGGRVTRLGYGTQMPGNMALGAADDEELTARAAAVIGDEVMSLGLNLDFAPVMDVNINPANPVIGTRSFSDDPTIVARHGIAYMKSLTETGAISTLKHFPGHGDTDTDSHTGLPQVDKSYDDLKKVELVPFAAAVAAGAEMIMTAHIQYPQIEKGEYVSKLTGEKINLPATLSKTILTDILRGDMGFDGVIITDAMDMDAIQKHFDKYDAAKMAIEAGVDIILMPVEVYSAEGIREMDEYIATLAGYLRNGEISEAKVDAAVLRVLKLKEKHGLLSPYAGAKSGAGSAVGTKAHHETEWDITKKTITMVKNDGGLLPLLTTGCKTVVLTAYDNEVLGMQYAIGRLQDEGKLAKDADIKVYSTNGKTAEEALALAAGADHVVVVTELGNAAGLAAESAATVDAIIAGVHGAGGDVTILSCNLPYDAARYRAADAIVLAWSARGMSEDPRAVGGIVAQYGPSMPAALYMMLSRAENVTGKLPIDIPKLAPDCKYSGEILYPRGYGLSFGEGSRAAFVFELWKKAGSPAAKGAAFSDVADGSWYAKAVAWAAEKGIIKGIGGGKFAPNADIRKEHRELVLQRYERL